MTTRDMVRSARSKIERVAYVVRRVIGVPDYDRYVAHLHAHHAGARPMDREEFIRQRLADRYNKPGSRCC
ncbi:MAG: hypothetical protein JWM41_1122 [Gemmatimonadetes bacterium]|nr:hypothetical protein [Gemmatimonadota bacterium]